MHLFLNCGLRVAEARNLNISDFNFTTDTFTIFGKGNKERTGYLNAITKEALIKYLDLRKNIQSKNPKDSNALFLSNERARISTRTMEATIEKAYIKAGLNEKVYKVHTLRHTCATILYRNGTDINTIKELLGHVKINTSEIYTHLHDQAVKKEMLEHPQVEIVLRALELYGYNLDYMLNSTDASDDLRQEKLALLKYTYEQVLATQAEQVDSKSDNIDNLPNLGKLLIKDDINSTETKRIFKVI